MQLNCPKCAAEIPAYAIELDRMVATCRVCHTKVILGDKPDSGRVGVWLNPAGSPKPSHVQVKLKRNVQTISWPWLTSRTALTSLLYIFFGAMSVLQLCAFFSDSMVDKPEGVWLLFTLLSPFIGIPSLYYAIAGYSNTTTVTLDKEELIIRHHPLPFIRANKTLIAEKIIEVYAERGDSTWSKWWDDYYDVYAILDDVSPRERLLAGLEGEEHSSFVVQEIERFLGIENQPMRRSTAVHTRTPR